MKAKDVMSAKVVTISCQATVLDAAKLMLDRGISGLPVVSEEGRLVGIVTAGDLLRHPTPKRSTISDGLANISSRTAGMSRTS